MSDRPGVRSTRLRLKYYSMLPTACSPHFRRMHLDILPIRPHRLALLVALERFAHVVRIAAVVVIVRDSAVD